MNYFELKLRNFLETLIKGCEIEYQNIILLKLNFNITTFLKAFKMLHTGTLKLDHSKFLNFAGLFSKYVQA